MEDKIDAALTCDKGCGHTVDYETCYAHQVQKVKNLLLEAQIKLLTDLENNSDCVEDGCGLDARLLADNLMCKNVELQEMLNNGTHTSTL